MKRIYKFICLLLTAAVALNILFSAAAAAAYTWESGCVYINAGGSMPFRPADGYLAQQNPPDFTWPFVEGTDVTYDLIVCNDEELTDVAYRKDGLTVNYYNFDTTFEAGKVYWWSVRYHIGGETSTWSDARRLRISLDAVPFTVPPAEEITARVPEGHPRIWTTPENLEEFRSYAKQGTGLTVFNKIKSSVTLGYSVSEPVRKEEDEFANETELQQYKMQVLHTAEQYYNNVLNAALVALIDPSQTQYRDYAIQGLLDISGWDYENGSTCYDYQDQAHRAIAYNCAIAYDWLYEYLTDEQKQTVLSMVTGRTDDMAYLTDSLKKNPFDSHGWTALGYIGIISLATSGDIPESAGRLQELVPMFAALLPPWSSEDGGWSQGTDYWQYSTISNREFMDVLYLGGILDLNQKAWVRNEYKWPLYVYPAGSTGAFGDGSNRVEPSQYTISSMSKAALFTQNPVAKWVYEQVGQLNTTDKSTYYTLPVEDMTSQTPVGYPKGTSFDDIGWAAMHSDLMDEDRVSLFFKSSPYGSFNHSHADQNSFIISAYGENLAIQGGYYDSYNSNHDKNFTRQTYAHNSVTIDGGHGQPIHDFTATGELTQFVTHTDFDAVTGDATEAYQSLQAEDASKLGRFKRNIIYVRPDVYVVIDDLQAADGKESSFEWWLNSEQPPEVEGNRAVITQNDAVLEATVQFPQDVTSKTYNNTFSGPDGIEYPAQGSYADRQKHSRVCFATPETAGTKMVTTMSVHKTSESAKEAEATYGDGYLKLTFDDGTEVFVNLGDGAVQAEDISFTGAAVVRRAGSVMLVDGTSLSSSTLTIEAQDAVTVAFGKEELAISSPVDTMLTLSSPILYSADINDTKGRPISSAMGVVLGRQGEELTLAMEKGKYQWGLNGKTAYTGIQNLQAVRQGSEIAVTWDSVPGTSRYEVKVGDDIIKTTNNSYRFPIPSQPVSVQVRAVRDGTGFLWDANGWSEALEVRDFADEFDDTADLDAWDVELNDVGGGGPSSVTVLNGSLVINDQCSNPNNAYQASPVVERNFSALSGKTELSFRFMLSDLPQEILNFELAIWGNNGTGSYDTAMRLLSFSDGQFGIALTEGSDRYIRMPGKITENTWITVRAVMDTDTQTCDLMIQSDLYKNKPQLESSKLYSDDDLYDAQEGIYVMRGLPFCNENNIASINMVRLTSQMYTGKINIDYLRGTDQVDGQAEVAGSVTETPGTDGKTRYSLQVENLLGGESSEVWFAVAEYDGTSMVNIAMTRGTVQGFSTETLSVEMARTGSDTQIKFFAWNGASMIPLAGSEALGAA